MAQKRMRLDDSAEVVGAHRFKKFMKIGEGTYGTVYKAYDLDANTCYAIKSIRFDSVEGVPGTCLREISILQALQHPNIIKLIDICPDTEIGKLLLIFEYIDYDLKQLMDKLRPKPLPMPYIKSFLWQLLRALNFCHSSRVLHRDLKPQNILVKTDGTIKLADFGLARNFSIPSRCYTQQIVTLWYRAPEVLLRIRFYSTAVDMWSLACVFAELVTSAPLFRADSEIELLYKIFKILGTPTPEIWPDIKSCAKYRDDFPKWVKCTLVEHVPGLDSDGLDLLAQMLLYPPEERINSKAALSHRFLGDVPVNLEPVTTLFG